MENCKPISTPVEKGLKLSKGDCPRDDQNKLEAPYAQAIGSLMYAMLCTRPDISYALGIVSRYQNNPGIKHTSK